MSAINLATQAVQLAIAPTAAAFTGPTSARSAVFPRPSTVDEIKLEELHFASAADSLKETRVTTPPQAPKPPENALTSLTKYIPTEILTLFVGTVSAKQALQELQAQWHTHFRMIHVYTAFIIFSSIFFLLVYLAGIKREQRPIPPLKKWPWFMMIASAIAFAVWALSVPGTGLIPAAAAAGAGLAALLVSIVFTHLEVIFTH
jgi:hypothetical protein